MKNRIVALFTCLVLLLTMVVPATLAFNVTGDDSRTVFTVNGAVEVPMEEGDDDTTPVGDDDTDPGEDKEPGEEQPGETEEPVDPEPEPQPETPAEPEPTPTPDPDTENPPVEEPVVDNDDEEGEDEQTPDENEDGKTEDEETPAGDENGESELVCTCGAAEGEEHAADCPLYEQQSDELPEGELPEELEPYEPLTNVTSFLNVAPLMNMQSLMTLDDYERAASDNGDVVLNKTAKANADGSFTITLEAYATGASHTESHYDPADIVLVLDTSGSMKYPMTDDGYEAVYGNTNKQNQDGTGKASYNSYTKGGITTSVETVTISNAYAVTEHDASNYDSNMRTYYVKNGNDFVPVYYYNGQDGYHNNQAGWFTYTKNGNSVVWNGPLIPKTSADDWNSNHVQFYRIKEDSTRLKALQDAANTFISNVLTTSPESSIAIVNFGGSAATTQGFSSSASTLQSAINGLTPNGATRADLGLSQANSLLENLDDTHKDHKKVVIMFTDGVPTSNSDFETDIANSAISKANSIKGGATVYTIGIFDGANGALSSFSTSDVNKYMHLVSSNYPSATSMTDTGNVNSELNDKSYYLSASNSAELMNIFQLISQEVGGATNTTLGTETVIKDIIAPSFTVPANTSDIKIYTADCIDAGLTFGIRTEVTSGITTTITGDTLDVKGFNFSTNWCGDHSGTYGGKKLIIEFTVSPKTGFLGGNDVPTNGEASGMYSNGSCIGNFEVPTVNVPIKDITIEASDKNVYLAQVPTEDQLKSGVTIKCGNVDISDPSKLEDWQTAYVDIESIFAASDDFNATADGQYTVTASVKPKTEGNSNKPGTVATEQVKTATKVINVFKPELTYKDSDVYYGDTAPAGYNSNLTNTQWKHGDTLSTAAAMIGNAPALTNDYTPEAGKIVDNKIATKSDIAVNVTVKIGNTAVTNYTTFQHTDCTGKTCGTPTNGKFWLHVKTCQLTITKTGGAVNESYVFDVYKDGVKYTEVTIWGNGSETIYELPVGNYTIQEDTGWSWRYSATNGSAVALSAQTASGSITCNNTSNTDKWLNGFSTIVKNIFGVTDDKKGN